MIRMKDEKIKSELSALIDKGKHLKEKLRSQINVMGGPLPGSKINSKLEPDVSEWSKRAKNLLRIRFDKNSEYYQDFVEEIENRLLDGKHAVEGGRFYKENVGNANGVLKTVYNALEKGLTEDLFYEREIGVFFRFTKSSS